MRLQNRACKRQRSEAVVVDQALHLMRMSSDSFGALRHAGVVPSALGLEVTVDPSGCRLAGSPGRVSLVREPGPTVRNRLLHIREPVEVVAVPEIEPPGAAALCADAEIRYTRTLVPSFRRCGLWNRGDDLVVPGAAFERSDDLSR